MTASSRKIRFEMKPPARIERECWIVSQLFEGYNGYVYEVANRWSLAANFVFAFKGNRFPENDDELKMMLNDNTFDAVLNIKDGIEWLKYHTQIMAEQEKWLAVAETCRRRNNHEH
jgi:hypothetical protein